MSQVNDVVTVAVFSQISVANPQEYGTYAMQVRNHTISLTMWFLFIVFSGLMLWL